MPLIATQRHFALALGPAPWHHVSSPRPPLSVWLAHRTRHGDRAVGFAGTARSGEATGGGHGLHIGVEALGRALTHSLHSPLRTVLGAGLRVSPLFAAPDIARALVVRAESAPRVPAGLPWDRAPPLITRGSGGEVTKMYKSGRRAAESHAGLIKRPSAVRCACPYACTGASGGTEARLKGADHPVSLTHDYAESPPTRRSRYAASEESSCSASLPSS
ncbi:unnamed protein product [Lampetra fluviatilis]